MTPPVGKLSAHEEGVQLVAVEITEVACVEAVFAWAWRPFVLPAECEGLLVDCIDLRPALGGERHHDAVADRRRRAVERLDHRDHRRVGFRCPRDERGQLHGTLGVQLGEQRIIKAGGAGEIVGSKGRVSDHRDPPADTVPAP